MIVYKKTLSPQFVPIIGANNRPVKNILLMQGSNEVDDKDWEKARLNCLPDLKTGKLKEEYTVAVKEPIDPKKPEGEKKTKKKGVAFKDLELDDALKVVEDCYNIGTLKKWEKKESRDSIRAALKNKIDEIEKFGAEKAKNLKEESV